MSTNVKLNLDYFENVILFKLLSDNRYAGLVIDKLKPTYFNNNDNKNIFILINNYYKDKEKIPNISEIKQYLSNDKLEKSFLTVVNNIKKLDKNINESEIISNTEKFIKDRGIFEIIWNVAKSEIIDADIISEKVQEICNISLVSDIGLNLFKDIDIVIDELKSPQQRISTGWKWLDDITKGGFKKNGNELWVFYGQPNIGKSIVLGNVSDNLAKQNLNVLLITLEMNEIDYAERLLNKITQLKTEELLKDVDKFKQLVEHNKQGNIFIKEFATASITPQFIRGYTEQLIKTGIKIDAIVIDYIDLICWNDSNIAEHIKKKKIAEHLRGTSKILKMPIITADQLNREGYDEEPDMSQAQGSTGNNMTADVIIGIYRTDDDIELGLMHFNVPKNRIGPKDITKVTKIDFNTLTIYEDETLDLLAEHEEAYNMFDNLNLDEKS